MKRRQFLTLSGAAFLAACDSGKSVDRLLQYAEKKNLALERRLFRHASMDKARDSAVLAGAALPVYFISNGVPMWDELARGAWTLTIKGMVKTPLTLTLAQLQGMTRVTQRVNHYCVEGWNAAEEWTGVRLSELLDAAGADPAANAVDFRSFDVSADGVAYHESWDMESARHPQTLICYGLDGAPLGPPHGGPARVFSPVKLGYKNTKYLTEILVLPEGNGGFWSDQGYEWYGGT